jgi:GTP-binding protein HflX
LSLRLQLAPDALNWRAKLHEAGCVRHENFDEQGNCQLQIQLSVAMWERLNKLSQALLQSCVLAE